MIAMIIVFILCWITRIYLIEDYDEERDKFQVPIKEKCIENKDWNRVLETFYQLTDFDDWIEFAEIGMYIFGITFILSFFAGLCMLC